MTIETAIKQAGGIKMVAAKCCITSTAVNAWKYRGSIPDHHLMDVLTLIRKNGHKVTRGELMAAEGQKPKAEVGNE